MIMRHLILILVFCIIANFKLFSQKIDLQTGGMSYSYCTGFHQEFCPPSENEFFTYNGQSRSALFYKGQTSSLNIIVYKGQDYRISFCFDEILGDKINFKLKNARTKKVLYDNAWDDYPYEFEFSVNLTQHLLIEVTVPEDESSAPRTDEGEPEIHSSDMGCLGVLIEQMPTPKSGF